MKRLDYIWRGNVENGKLTLREPEKFKQYTSSLRGEIELILRKWRSRRSNSQNALYWMYLNLISEQTGNTEEDLHEIFKKSFLIPKIIKYKGQEVEVPKSTTELDKGQFVEYLSKIEFETGIPVPDTDKIEFKV